VLDKLTVGFDPVRASKTYDETGWFVANSILDLALMDRARQIVQSIHTKRPDQPLSPALEEFLGWPIGQPRPRQSNQYITLQYGAIADLLLSPLIGRIAAALARTSEIRVFNSALIVKEPGLDSSYTSVAWHCDKAFWPTCSSQNMITAWIPLQDTNEDLGTLNVLSGSHSWTYDKRFSALGTSRTFLGDNKALVEDTLRSSGQSFDPVPVELRAGQVSFHHMATLHASGVNRGSETRYALSLHLQDVANRYQAAVEPDGSPASYVHDRIVRRLSSGEPDYSDPYVCPVIWSAADDSRAS